jgi:2-polyprenyl-6-methoxyphenol hydroxylase-like FAD-dependent oxidoreductase
LSRQPKLVVVGAGAVGVVAALAAAQAGFDVTIFESAPEVDHSPRAATTHPSTLEMIDRLGLLDRFLAEGLVARDFQFWDRENHSLVATFDHDVLRDDTPFPFAVQTEQHKLAHMGLDALRSLGCAIHFGTRVTSSVQNADRVTLEVETEGAPATVDTDWVIAADGGRSTMRKNLGIEFEGYTWPERFIVLTVLDDMQKHMQCCYRNYLAGEGEWVSIFKVAGDDGHGRWRVVSPTRPDETDEEALSDAAVASRLERAYPLGRPYQLIHRNLYRVHQRVAATFRAGRILLAGDAAHVNNPLGGLGLNFGIHDAMDAVVALAAVAMHGADEALLDNYAQRRRALNIEYVQQQTIANKKRLEPKSPEARRADFDELRATAEDRVRARAFLLRSSLISSVREARTMA